MLKKTGLWIVIILILPAAIGGSYFYYKRKANQVIYDFVQQFSPVANIRFEELSIDLEGKIELKSVQVAPVGFKDVVLIDRINLKTAGPLSLLSAGSWFRGSLPEALKLDLTGIIFSVDSDFVTRKKSYSAENYQEKTLWGLACAEQSNFITLADSLGLSRLQVDAQINITSATANKGLRAGLSVSAPGLFRGMLEFELSSKVALDLYERVVLRQTKLSNAKLYVADLGFNLKRLKYCAKSEAIPESNYAEYFKANVQLKGMAGNNIELPELEKSVLAFFKPKANVMFKLIPKQPLYLPEVFSSQFDLITTEGLSLTVHKQAASTQYLALLKGFVDVDLASVEIKKEQVMLADIKESVVKKTQYLAGYRSVSQTELAAYEGQNIRLKTLLGREFQGVLLKDDDDKILMQRRVEQGVVTYPVLKADIDSIKVFR
jgi:hypothetical protein